MAYLDLRMAAMLVLSAPALTCSFEARNAIFVVPADVAGEDQAPERVAARRADDSPLPRASCPLPRPLRRRVVQAI